MQNSTPFDPTHTLWYQQEAARWEEALPLGNGRIGAMVFGGGSYPNLPDAHPPFQIDGNFGAATGIAHMLLGSIDHAIHLLPALPACWSGSVHGLRAMGGLLVDIRFVKGTLENATVSVPEGCTPPAVLYQGKPADSRLTIAPVRF